LYLVWLLGVQEQELGDDELEPAVPAGLGELSGPQQAFVEFMRLDRDLLAAVAEASAPLVVKAPSDAALKRWVKARPAADKDAWLLRILRGDGAPLRTEMLRELHGTSVDPDGDGARTAGELLEAAEQLFAKRQEVVRRREAQARRRQEKAAAEARALRLAELRKDTAAAWSHVETLIESKKPKEYDVAVTLLVDLRDLAFLDGETDGFEERMRLLRVAHARKPSLLDRLARVRLD
jgi:hypothetical protein